MSDSQEQLTLSSKAIIEANNPNFNESGKKAFGINATNSDDVRFNLTHSDGSDITNLESEGILDLRTGSKVSKDGTSCQITSLHGKIAINAEDGSISIKADGKSITLDAESIFLKGRKLIQIGDGGEEIQIMAKKINAVGASGNVVDVLSYHNLVENSFLQKAAEGTCFTGSGKKHKPLLNWVS